MMWKTLNDYPNYECSNWGNVRNKNTGKAMKHCKYHYAATASVCIKDDGNFVRLVIQDIMESLFTNEEITGEYDELDF